MIPYVPLARHKIVTNNYWELNIEQKFKDTISIITKELTNTENSHYINKIYLFGSCAKQETKYSSDVDILIVLQDGVDIQCLKEFFREIINKAEHKYRFKVDYDLVFYTQESFDYGKMPLTLAIRNNNILLYSRKEVHTND